MATELAPGQAPADLHGGAERRSEGDVLKADEADELVRAGYLDGPEAEAMCCDVALQPGRGCVALLAGERNGEPSAHQGVGVQGSEGWTVAVAPGAEQEAERAQPGHAGSARSGLLMMMLR